MKFKEYIEEEKRWVYGTKDQKWHLVGPNDRDFNSGIGQKEFRKIGKAAAKKQYLKEAKKDIIITIKNAKTRDELDDIRNIFFSMEPTRRRKLKIKKALEDKYKELEKKRI